MKKKFANISVLVFFVVVPLYLFSCQNSFLADVTKQYKVTFETNGGTEIASYRTGKIESSPKTTKSDYEFDGWYTNSSFDGNAITFPYELKNDTTLYAKCISKYCTITYVDGKTVLDSIVIDRGNKLSENQLPELIKEDYVVDGWYTNASFVGRAISFPYEVKTDITLYVNWIVREGCLILDFENCRTNEDFVNNCINYGYESGVLKLDSKYDKIIFKGNSSQTAIFSNLCIESSRAKQKLVFENFSFSSSKSSPLIKSSFDIDIEYKGTNKISSTSSDTVSLIKSLGLITFKETDNNSSFEIQPNAVTSSKEGSIGIEANNVIIDGGNFVIQGSNGVDYSENDTSGTSGRNGSSGIRATETIIQNKANVTITGGNGGKGSQGIKGDDGCSGSTRDSVAEGNAENGTNGVQGGIGGTGGKGGSAILGNFEVKSGCNVILVGGNGGTGGKGGTGGTGGKGGDNVAWGGGTGNGGDGGRGGTGGTGGNGGDAVSGSFYQENFNDNVYLKFGSKGVGGTGGNGGIGGLKGNANYVVPPFPECGDGGTNGNPGDPGSKGNSGEDGVEHR